MFNDLSTKAYDMKIHLNKCKKTIKKIVVSPGYLIAAITPRDRTQYGVSLFSSKKPYVVKSKATNDLAVAQMAVQIL